MARSPYVTKADIQLTRMSQPLLLEALDDDGDGVEDPGTFDAIEGAVAREIDGILGQRFPVPFADPVPNLVKTAAEILICEMLYARRKVAAAENPWTDRAREQREKLSRIATGEENFEPGANRKPSRTPGIVISEPAKTYPSNGGLIV